MLTTIETNTVEVIGALHRRSAEYFVDATLLDGKEVRVSPPYQINEVGFRPFRAAKGSPEDLQTAYEDIVAKADELGHDLGLETEESVRKLLAQNGIGIDCSRFFMHVAGGLFDTLGLDDVYEHVYIDPDLVLRQMNASNWPLRGSQYEATERVNQAALSSEELSVAEVCRMFVRDPEFITGSRNICSDRSTTVLDDGAIIKPGDVVAHYDPIDISRAVHVGMVMDADGYVREDGSQVLKVHHSWHPRVSIGGIRDETVDSFAGYRSYRNNPAMMNPARYSRTEIRRFNGLIAD